MSTAPSFDSICKAFRQDIKLSASKLKAFKEATATYKEMDAVTVEINEVLANLTLAYRHLEDAAMRLGKAIQAADGGVSVYDK
jgi:hypothetical protein